MPKQLQYDFDEKEFMSSLLSVLSQTLAVQFLTFDAIVDTSNKTDAEKAEIKKELFRKLPAMKAKILDGLYTDFGATPSIN